MLKAVNLLPTVSVSGGIVTVESNIFLCATGYVSSSNTALVNLNHLVSFIIDFFDH